MATASKKTKKKNPADLTLRNLRAMKKRIQLCEARLSAHAVSLALLRTALSLTSRRTEK